LVQESTNYNRYRYEVNSNLNYKVQKYAPFSSLEPKFSSHVEKKNSLGPGQYDVGKNIGEPSFTKI
jgi:hypothetical protein